MENTVPIEMTPDEAASLNELIEQCSRIIGESNARSESIFTEITRLQSDTRFILENLRAMLNVETTL